MNHPLWEISTILLDLDGTLLDSAPDMIAATNAMMMECGFPPLADQVIVGMLGKGVRYLALNAMATATGKMPEASEAEMTVARFKQHYHQTNGRYTRQFPGVLEGLGAFKEAGFRLACVTNKIEEFTMPLLERMNILPFLDLVVSGDTTSKNKPDPEPLFYAMKQLKAKRALMIGDSANDVLSARNANLPVICMTYGYGGKSVNADAFADTFLDVLPMIRFVSESNKG